MSELGIPDKFVRFIFEHRFTMPLQLLDPEEREWLDTMIKNHCIVVDESGERKLAVSDDVDLDDPTHVAVQLVLWYLCATDIVKMV